MTVSVECEDSPPLARGAHLRTFVRLVDTGLTPARAGSTTAAIALSRAAWDSPPLARGAPDQ